MAAVHACHMGTLEEPEIHCTGPEYQLTSQSRYQNVTFVQLTEHHQERSHYYSTKLLNDYGSKWEFTTQGNIAGYV